MHFLWPAPIRFLKWLRVPDKFEKVQLVVAEYVLALRLPFYFWLGLRGFVGALLWLVAYFGVLMLTAPAAYDSVMSMIKKKPGDGPPAQPPQGGGYPPPGGGYPPPGGMPPQGGGYPPQGGGGYPPPQGGGGYPPQQGGGWQ